MTQAVERIRSARQAVQQQEEKLAAAHQDSVEEREKQDTFNESWTQQRYTGKQLLKKKDIVSFWTDWFVFSHHPCFVAILQIKSFFAFFITLYYVMLCWINLFK